jgi:hypothetical protein
MCKTVNNESVTIFSRTIEKKSIEKILTVSAYNQRDYKNGCVLKWLKYLI